MAQRRISPQLTLRAESAQVQFDGASSAANKELSIHRWSNWIAGFSGDFARSAIQQYLPFPRPDSLVLDPFAGVGTTLLEAYRQGIDSVGFEINPYACLISKVKLEATLVDVGKLREAIQQYQQFIAQLEPAIDQPNGARPSLSRSTPKNVPPKGFKSRIHFFSSSVEQKVLHSIDFLQTLPSPVQDLFRVALASVMVDFSNYTYEPSLSSRPASGKSLILTAPVGDIVVGKLQVMAEDIQLLQNEVYHRGRTPRCDLHPVSFFQADKFMKPQTVDLVLTSPPYMNNYHYVRNTRPQLFWTSLVESSKDLKRLEEENFGKFWQTVRGRDPIPLEFHLPELDAQIESIRALNTEKGAYGGRGWANYIATYMNDLHKFCGQVASLLRPGGAAIVVIGNSVIQGSEIPVGRYLAQIAQLQQLVSEDIVTLRSRVGSSIVNTGARLAGHEKYGLYDFAVTLRLPG